MKKVVVFLLSIVTCISFLVGCVSAPETPPNDDSNIDADGGGVGDVDNDEDNDGNDEQPQDWLTNASEELKTNLSADGYVRNSIGDFSQYVGTPAYRTVSTA